MKEGLIDGFPPRMNQSINVFLDTRWKGIYTSQEKSQKREEVALDWWYLLCSI